MHISGALGNKKKREARRVTVVDSRAADRVFLLLTHLAVADGTGKVMDTPSFVKSTEHCNKSERVAPKMFLLTEKMLKNLIFTCYAKHSHTYALSLYSSILPMLIVVTLPYLHHQPSSQSMITTTEITVYLNLF